MTMVLFYRRKKEQIRGMHRYVVGDIALVEFEDFQHLRTLGINAILVVPDRIWEVYEISTEIIKAVEEKHGIDLLPFRQELFLRALPVIKINSSILPRK